MLLLGLRCGCCGSGSLCLSLRLRRLCLRLELTVLGYMVIGMLVVTLRPLARVVLLLLLREEVLHLLHLSRRSLGWAGCCGEDKCGRWIQVICSHEQLLPAVVGEER